MPVCVRSRKKYFDDSLFTLDFFDDQYEKYSIVIGAYDGQKLIGTLRMIFSSPLSFYAVEDFNIDFSGRSDFLEIVEIDRYIVKKNYRKKSLVSFGMLREANLISRKKGIKYWLVVISEELKNSSFSRIFGIKHIPLSVKPPTEKQLKVRSKLPNYYAKNNPAPYLIYLNDYPKI